jgi:hypothetical protein
MIHFQADQEGAFLRVSELKPAFDRFLWEKVFENDFDKNYAKLVGYVCREDKTDNKNELQNLFKEDLRALDYTVEIDIPQTESWSLKEGNNSFPCFFATMGDFDKEKTKLVFTQTDFEIRIICFNSRLLEEIKINFAHFLCIKNFGTRQGKGFGSFSVIIDNNPVVDFIHERKNKGWYSYRISNCSNKSHEDFKSVFKNIDTFWKCLRNGLERQKIPSALEKYVESNPDIKHKFDKNTFREIVKATRNLELWEEEEKDSLNEKISETRIYRDVLGLATSTMWLHNKVQDRELVKSIKNIERLKSPVIFKPIKEGQDLMIYIFVDINENYKRIMQEVVEINVYNIVNKEKELCKNQLSTNNEDQEKSFYLKMVNTLFSIRKFMDYVESDYKKYFNKSFSNRNGTEYSILLNNFNSLTKLPINS